MKLTAKLKRLAPPRHATLDLGGTRDVGVAEGDAVASSGWEVHAAQLEPDHHHGRLPVCGALTVDSETLSVLALDPGLAEVDVGRMLLLDTETTGLAGGTGTVPFLVGLGWFEDGCLRVEQLLLRSLGEERPLLERLAERLRAASCVVSYNGKSFDWPLLRTRYILNRVPAPPLPPHVDLLHCARRVFRGRLDNVRLTQVEAQVLGFVREGDVAGAEIPGLYQHFLRTGEADVLTPVLEHNRHDVVALAALLGKLGASFAEVCWQDDPRDHLAYAKVAARAAHAERAQRFARAAAEGKGRQGSLACEAWMLIARLARRRGEPEVTRVHLLDALAAATDADMAAHVHLALAKLYEHKLRDWTRALEHAAHTEPAEDREAQGRRIQRLERKLRLDAKRSLEATPPSAEPCR